MISSCSSSIRRAVGVNAQISRSRTWLSSSVCSDGLRSRLEYNNNCNSSRRTAGKRCMTTFSNSINSIMSARCLSRAGAGTSAGVINPWEIQKRFLKRPALNTSQLKEGRRTGALAMKVGMLALFDQWGVRHAATVLQLDECEVVQVKTVETDGYTGLQLGVGEAKVKRVGVTVLGHVRKAGLSKPKRKIAEFRVTPDALLAPGTKIGALHFVPGQRVDVCGTSKGKGFQGGMKRWNFSGGRASHGNSLNHRTPGSTGNAQDPGRVFKGKKMPGRMGTDRITVQNLYILKIDPSRDLVYVKGAVPGNNGTFVRITDAVKGPYFPETAEVPFPTFDYSQYQLPVSLIRPESHQYAAKNEENLQNLFIEAAEEEELGTAKPKLPVDVLLAPVSEKDPLVLVEPDIVY